MDLEKLSRESRDDDAAMSAYLRALIRHGEIARALDVCESGLAHELIRRTLREVIEVIPSHWRWFTARSVEMGTCSELRWWQDHCKRIANIARMLSNPQPENVLVDGREVISPYHALRLYVDALIVAKGRFEWFDWLSECLDPNAIGRRLMMRDVIAPWGVKDHYIIRDGEVSWGSECPVLPVVG